MFRLKINLHNTLVRFIEIRKNMVVMSRLISLNDYMGHSKNFLRNRPLALFENNYYIDLNIP